MIKLIQIQNFQSHLYTELELSPGVNIIIGESDNGKSVIIRLLRWVFENAPKGFSFKHKHSGEKDVTFGCVVFDDDSLIIRSRDNKRNCYILEDETILQALRTDVPQEIREISRVRPINIQTQHPKDQYFLIGEKPGYVAKEFNRVSNLEVMDRTIKVANTRIRKTSTRIDFLDEEISIEKNKLESFYWLEKAKKAAQELLVQNDLIEEKVREFTELERTILSMEELGNQLEKLQPLDKCEASFQKLLNFDKEIQKKVDAFNDLDGLVFSYEKTITKLSAYTDIDKCLKALYALEKTSGELKRKITDASILRNLITQLAELDKMIDYSEKELKILEKKFHDELGKDLCPLCGGTIK